MPDQFAPSSMHPDEGAAAGGTTSLPSSPVNSSRPHFSPRPRRQTESAVYQAIDAPRRSRSHLSPVVRFSTQTTTTEFHPEGRLLKGQTERQTRRAGSLKDHSDNSIRKKAMMMGDDPRDTGRAAALTSSGRASSSSSSFSPAAHPPFSSPRLPQSRFSFEFHYPLRKRALSSAHHPSHSVPIADHAASSSVAPDSSPTPQRTLLYDRNRRSVPNLHLSHLRSSTTTASASQPSSLRPVSTLEKDGESARPPHARSSGRVLSPNATKRRSESSLYAQSTRPSVKRRMPSSTLTYVQGRPLADERDRASNGVDHGPDDGSRTPIADDTRSKNEDIFLNIARSDSTRRESLGRSDLRRSRLRMSGSGLRSPASRVNEQTPSPDQLRMSAYDTPLHSNNGSPSTPYSSLSYSYSASAHPLDDHSRSHHSNYVPSSRSTIGLPRSRFSRASPEASPHSPENNVERRASLQDPRSYRHSSLSTIRSSRQTSTSEATERARQEHDRARQDGTESTLSTTAPSTVWDELEDLKSRIRKLELTGKLPPSSQEAISSASADRPRTATTTMTTMSSSPRHDRKTSVPSNDSDTITVPNPVHPLLQSALAKAKEILSKEVYSALEAAVMDALGLSNFFNSGKAPSGSVSVVNGYGSSDRYSKRKVDSVCRSLTELCLALSDEQHRRQESLNVDGVSAERHSFNADEGASTPTLSFSRSTSQEPEALLRRQSINHSASRLESRRTSLAASGNPSSDVGHNQIKTSESTSEAKQTQSPGSSAPASRLSRLSTSLRTRRLQAEDEHVESRPSHNRSLSRSMTDIGAPAYTHRVSPRQRTSQLYTASPAVHEPSQNQNPRFSSQTQQSQLPQPRTPTASQSGLPLRRSMMTPSYTPATPRSSIQVGARRYGVSPAVSTVAGDGPNDDAASVAHEAPQTRITASNKVATSYTPIQQNRIRTNSLGARRFGLRQRPLSTVDKFAGNSFDDSID